MSDKKGFVAASKASAMAVPAVEIAQPSRRETSARPTPRQRGGSHIFRLGLIPVALGMSPFLAPPAAAQTLSGHLESVSPSSPLTLTAPSSWTVTTAGAAARSTSGLYVTTGGIIKSDTPQLTINTVGGYGVQNMGGTIELLSGATSITTTGTGAATGYGIYASGSSAVVKAERTSVTTQGSGAYGVYVINGGQVSLTGASRVETRGTNTHAAYVNNGTLTLADTTLVTTGTGARGMYADSGNATINASGVSVTTGTAATPTDNAFGAYAFGGGNIELSGTGNSIQTYGNTAHGLYVNNLGSAITASNITIITNGGVAGTPTTAAYGVNAIDSGQVTLTGATIETHGEGARGLSGNSNAVINGKGGVSVTTGSAGTPTDNAYGAYALGGSRITLDGTGNSVRTYGNTSYGLYANGSGSAITANDVTVTTGVAGTATTGAYGVYANNGGQVSLTGASRVETFGNNTFGLYVNHVNAGITTNGAAIETHGTSAHAASTAGGTLTLTDTTLTTTGTGARGLYADGTTASAAINGKGGVAVTTGTETTPTDNAYGIYALAGGKIELAGTGNSVRTYGGSAYGLYANGSGSAITANDITVTTGVSGTATTNVYGVIANNSGQISLTGASRVETHGANAHAAYATGGTVTLTGTTLTTTGTGARGMSADGTSGNAAINASGVTVTTGTAAAPTDNAYGAYALTGGKVTLSGTGNSIQTYGSAAHGLYANGSNSTITANDLTVTTGVSGTATTGAHGVFANNSGQVSLTGASRVETFGGGSHGLFVNHQSAGITTNGAAIETHGASAHAAYASSGALTLDDTTLTTTGTGARGLNADGGSVVVNASNLVITTGTAGAPSDNAIGLYALNGAQVTLSGTGNRIETFGRDSHGLRSNSSGAHVTVSAGTTVTTHGTEAWGIYANSNSSIDLTAGGVGGISVLTTGGDRPDGSRSYAVFATNTNAFIDATALTVETRGAGGYGVYADSGAAIALGSNSTIRTAQADAIGLNANGGPGAAASRISAVANTTVTTLGENAFGVYALNNGVVDLGSGATIRTSGDRAYGLYSQTGSVADSSISATNVSVVTGAGDAGATGTGDFAHGIYVYGASKLDLWQGTVTTHGDNAAGARIEGVGATLNFNDTLSSLTTYGANAHGFVAVAGASKTFNAANPLPSIVVHGDTSAVLSATGDNGAGTASHVTLDGTALSTAMTDMSAASVYNWGAKAQNGGIVEFTNGASSGGTGLWAIGTGSTGSAATILFSGGSSATGSRVQLGAGGLLDISANAVDLAIGSLEGAGNVALGTQNLTIGGYSTTADSASTIFSGGIDGTGSLVKQGTGTLTLSGSNAFNYTGNTTVNDGVLAVRNISPADSLVKTFTLNGGWLDLSATTWTGNESDANGWSGLTLQSGPNAAASGGVIGRDDVVFYSVSGGNSLLVDYQVGRDNGSGTVDKEGVYLVKEGAGTLILAHANEYVGNTQIRQGTLQISQDNQLGNTAVAREIIFGNAAAGTQGTLAVTEDITSARQLWLDQSGAVDVASGKTAQFGAISELNAGQSFTKLGGGTLILTNTSTHTGATDVLGGNGNTLALATGSRLDGTTGGTVDSGATLGGYGSSTGSYVNAGTIAVANALPVFAGLGAGNLTLGSLTNAGLIQIGAASGTGNTLTLTGDYTGQNGLIVINTVLGDDNSATDKLIAQGATHGASSIRVVNQNGRGARTNDGIQIVEVQGASAADAFTLSNRVVAGVYEYKLYQGTPSADDGNWYLRSGDDPVPEPGVYVSNRIAAEGLFVHTLHDRLGEPQYTENGKQQNSDRIPSGWVRVIGNHSDNEARAGGGRFDLTQRSSLVQIGTDLARWNDAGDNRWLFGLMAGYGSADTTAKSKGYGKAKGSLDGYNVGLYATWYQSRQDRTGPYVDSWLQYGWYDNKVKSTTGTRSSYDSNSLAASLEGGWAFLLRDRQDAQILVELQAQVIYGRYDADQYTDADGARVENRDRDSVTTRLGARLFGRYTLDNKRLAQPFIEANWWHSSGGGNVSYNSVVIDSNVPASRYELKLGVQAEIAKNWNVWGHVGAQTGQNDFSRIEGLIGMKYLW